MTTQKTLDQLKREIAYYAGLIQRTTSRDRIRRAHIAIRVRERQLKAALQVRLQVETKHG
jgi:hypothetical protein